MTVTRLLVLVIFHAALWAQGASARSTEIHYLSGIDKDNTVDWEFWVSGGRKAQEWTSIPVPSNWEMQGFGTHRYWSDWADEEAPDKEGRYKFSFPVPAEWQGRVVDIVFGGVMTDAEVRINGKLAGPMHQGGFYEFRYGIESLLHYGQENLMEVNVQRFSSDKSINLAERRADYWMFSGIYRPVWLEARPAQHIRRIALDAGYEGDFQAQVFLGGVTAGDKLVGRIFTLDGKPVSRQFSATVEPFDQELVELAAQVKGVKAWSAETPHLYKLVVELKRGRRVLHTEEEIFGFRTVDLRPRDGLYVNGKKVRLKGVNRHSSWPDSGRTTSEQISRQDIELIKSMNMNAIRVGHAPPDSHFLKVADELGVYVINELGGWQDAYSVEAGRPLVKEMIIRDHNHPSVIIWANGNEGGWNTELDADFSHWDFQKRPLIHPWALFGGIDTSHYETYACCSMNLFGGKELFMPTEFLHALYDGGAAAGLDDWWSKMVRHPLSVGGFIWVFADEGIVRDDRPGTLDTAGNSAPDGIVGPYREKEASYYAIREIWSPVYFPLSELSTLPETFNGKMEVENRYDFTDLEDINFSWELRRFTGPRVDRNSKSHRVDYSDKSRTEKIIPGRTGELRLKLPDNWRRSDALTLTATDPQGRLIHTWTWMISSPADIAQQLLWSSSDPVTAHDTDTRIQLTVNDLSLSIDKKSGYLTEVLRDGKAVSFRNGPRSVEGDSELKKISLFWEGSVPVIQAEYQGRLRNTQWRLHPNGWLQVNYALAYPQSYEAPYLGVTFDYPEEKVKGVRWLGRGPYRVWKNRLKGMTHDVWSNTFNDAITGQAWNYPEFKGFFREFHWAVLDTHELPITLATSNENNFLRLFTPTPAVDPMDTRVEFPPGDISFLQGIIPIGSKFHPAEKHGPQGFPNRIDRLGRWYSGEIFLYFGNFRGDISHSDLPTNNP